MTLLPRLNFSGNFCKYLSEVVSKGIDSPGRHLHAFIRPFNQLVMIGMLLVVLRESRIQWVFELSLLLFVILACFNQLPKKKFSRCEFVCMVT